MRRGSLFSSLAASRLAQRERAAVMPSFLTARPDNPARFRSPHNSTLDHMKSLIRTTILVAVSMLGQTPFPAQAQSDIQSQVQKLSLAEKQEAFIAALANQAKGRDAEAILMEIDPAALKANGEAASRTWLQAEVFPFFAAFTKMHTYKSINGATLPDGRQGLWHYAYIIDANGKILPFSIALVETNEGIRIANLIVNNCVKGRHPICS
jgi:hypothetical protein